MAGTLYSLALAGPIADLSEKLTSYYGAGYTELYKDASYLIFTLPAVTDKYIRIYWANGYYVVQYGTGYVSGTTITGGTNFSGTNYSAYNSWKVIMFADSLIFLTTTASYPERGGNKFTILGKLSNDEFIVIGAQAATWEAGDYRCINTTTGVESIIVSPAPIRKILSSGGKILVGDVWIVQPGTGYRLESGGNPVTLNNVKSCTWGAAADYTQEIGTGYIITPRSIYCVTSGNYYQSSSATGFLLEVA